MVGIDDEDGDGRLGAIDVDVDVVVGVLGEDRAMPPPTFLGIPPAGRNNSDGICPAVEDGGGGLVGLPGVEKSEGGRGSEDLRGAGVMGTAAEGGLEDAVDVVVGGAGA